MQLFETGGNIQYAEQNLDKLRNMSDLTSIPWGCFTGVWHK